MFSHDAQWSTHAAVVATNLMDVALEPILTQHTSRWTLLLMVGNGAFTQMSVKLIVFW